MKLKHFIGKDIRGYMNFDIHFNDSITFLIGINGSGKTTILKLLSGLLGPSYIELAQIEFSYIELICERLNSDGERISICCRKKGDIIKLSLVGATGNKVVEDEFKIIPLPTSREQFAHEPFEMDRINRALIEFDSLNVVGKIKDLKTPLFLGLNRRTDGRAASFFEREAYYTSYSRHRNFNIEMLFDSVDKALNEIEDMFHTYVRRNAQSQYAISEDFRRKVFSESFKVEKDFLPSLDYRTYIKELKNLESRREQLNIAIDKLDVPDLSSQFSTYFDSIEETLGNLIKTSPANNNEQPSAEHIHALLQWMIKFTQFEKIDNIIRYAEEYSYRIQKSRELLDRFIDSANLFFNEGKKAINIDKRGDVKISIYGSKRENTIYELSSGEKQLIILLAHIAFLQKNNAPIFIIDEPELSLHISWQELFVDALLKASPHTQYILATHAPAIISKIERRESCIDLTQYRF